MNIVYAGTPEFALPALEAMVAAGRRPIAVYTQPDRPAGRGRQLAASPVKRFAESQKIPVVQPESLHAPDAIAQLTALRPDLMVVVAYGIILPPQVLAIPLHGCWNVHASLLPRWRGAAPIQRAIEAGDRETGVCIMQMDEGLDTGPVLHAERTAITADETGGSLHDRLAGMGARALLYCLERLQAGSPPEPIPQPESNISSARKLDKREARIDWSQPAEVLERRVRAFNPWPVAWCYIGEERTRIWKAEVTGQRSTARPGDIIEASASGISVATGDGVLRLLELQRPGGRRISAADYLNANPRLPRTLDSG